VGGLIFPIDADGDALDAGGDQLFGQGASEQRSVGGKDHPEAQFRAVGGDIQDVVSE